MRAPEKTAKLSVFSFQLSVLNSQLFSQQSVVSSGMKKANGTRASVLRRYLTIAPVPAGRSSIPIAENRFPDD
jgi:hypothetical protein